MYPIDLSNLVKLIGWYKAHFLNTAVLLGYESHTINFTFFLYILFKCTIQYIQHSAMNNQHHYLILEHLNVHYVLRVYNMPGFSEIVYFFPKQIAYNYKIFNSEIISLTVLKEVFILKNNKIIFVFLNGYKTIWFSKRSISDSLYQNCAYNMKFTYFAKSYVF